MRASVEFYVDSIERAARLSMWAALAAVAFLSVVACGGDRDLLVFAATSLRDPLTEISERYENESGVNVDLSFGASQALAQQIASGAPADVFISAGEGPAIFLEKRGFASNAKSERLLGNEIIVATLRGGGEIASVESLASDSIKRIALANPSVAPAGAYAEEALRTVGIWDSVQDKLLLGKDVRAAMAYVEAGNADAGIVYRTDALSSDRLKIALVIEGDLHSPIAYPAVAVNDFSNRSEALNYLEYLYTEEAMSVFRRYGFSDPPAK